MIHVDRMRSLWREHSAELLAEFVAQNPGRRPWSWWAFDATEPRRQISGTGTLLTEHFRNMRTPLDRGVPLFDSIDPSDAPTFESEPSYLLRLGLFAPGERERIAPEAFTTPEAVVLDQ